MSPDNLDVLLADMPPAPDLAQDKVEKIVAWLALAMTGLAMRCARDKDPREVPFLLAARGYMRATAPMVLGEQDLAKVDDLISQIREGGL